MFESRQHDADASTIEARPLGDLGLREHLIVVLVEVPEDVVGLCPVHHVENGSGHVVQMLDIDRHV